MIDQRNFEYMFYGFAAAWLLVFAYVLSLVRRAGRIRAELKRLETMLDHRVRARPT